MSRNTTLIQITIFEFLALRSYYSQKNLSTWVVRDEQRLVQLGSSLGKKTQE